MQVTVTDSMCTHKVIIFVSPAGLQNYVTLTSNLINPQDCETEQNNSG